MKVVELPQTYLIQQLFTVLDSLPEERFPTKFLIILREFFENEYATMNLQAATFTLVQ